MQIPFLRYLSAIVTIWLSLKGIGVFIVELNFAIWISTLKHKVLAEGRIALHVAASYSRDHSSVDL